MPGGDDDDEVEDIPEDTCFLQGLAADEEQEWDGQDQTNVEEDEEER